MKPHAASRSHAQSQKQRKANRRRAKPRERICKFVPSHFAVIAPFDYLEPVVMAVRASEATAGPALSFFHDGQAITSNDVVWSSFESEKWRPLAWAACIFVIQGGHHKCPDPIAPLARARWRIFWVTVREGHGSLAPAFRRTHSGREMALDVPAAHLLATLRRLIPSLSQRRSRKSLDERVVDSLLRGRGYRRNVSFPVKWIVEN